MHTSGQRNHLGISQDPHLVSSCAICVWTRK